MLIFSKLFHILFFRMQAIKRLAVYITKECAIPTAPVGPSKEEIPSYFPILIPLLIKIYN